MRIHRCVTWALAGTLFLFIVAAICLPRISPDWRPLNCQRAQFLSIAQTINYVDHTIRKLPSSTPVDSEGLPYCGAMRLCELLVGQDGLGFHKDSVFRADGMDSNGVTDLYPAQPGPANLAQRIPPWHDRFSCARRLEEIYGPQNTGPFAPTTLVMCDVHKHKLPNGATIGTPILYYKVRRNWTVDDANDLAKVFDPADNFDLLALGAPWNHQGAHPLRDNPNILFKIIWKKAGLQRRDSITPSSFLLISAGHDGLFGTQDDDCLLQR